MSQTDYRYYPYKGLRRKYKPLGDFEGHELRSEEFDSYQEFALAIASDVLDFILTDIEDREGEDESQE